jgi:hypothetical protein
MSQWSIEWLINNNAIDTARLRVATCNKESIIYTNCTIYCDQTSGLMGLAQFPSVRNQS